MDVTIEVVGESLKVSAVGFGRVAVLGHVPLAPSDSDRRRFFARCTPALPSLASTPALSPKPSPTSVSGSRRHQPERSEAKVFAARARGNEAGLGMPMYCIAGEGARECLRRLREIYFSRSICPIMRAHQR